MRGGGVCVFGGFFFQKKIIKKTPKHGFIEWRYSSIPRVYLYKDTHILFNFFLICLCIFIKIHRHTQIIPGPPFFFLQINKNIKKRLFPYSYLLYCKTTKRAAISLRVGQWPAVEFLMTTLAFWMRWGLLFKPRCLRRASLSMLDGSMIIGLSLKYK